MSTESLVKRYPNVHCGLDVRVDDFCILGEPAKGVEAGALPLMIGDYSIIRSHSVLYAGVRVGKRFQCGHSVLIRENSIVGDDCSIGSGSVVEFEVTMEDGVRLHSQCFVPEYSYLEAGCWLGPRVVVTNARYPAALRTKKTLEAVRVGQRAIIGANATLLPGIVVGAGSLVGAGAVVLNDVKAGTIVVGNPARSIGMVRDLADAEGYIYR